MQVLGGVFGEPRSAILTEVRACYVDTMSKVLRQAIHGYVSSLRSLQQDIASRTDLLGAEENAQAAVRSFLRSLVVREEPRVKEPLLGVLARLQERRCSET